MTYFLESVGEYFKTVAIGDLSGDFVESHFSGTPFRIISGEKILCANMKTKEYHWFEDTVLLYDHNNNRYVFDMIAYHRLLHGSSRKLIALEDLKCILNADVIKEDQAARVIQKAFKKHLYQKRSAIVIQRNVLKYLYRPGGTLAMRRKRHYEELAV